MKTDIEQVREAMLTPEQIESLADFVLKYGDLDNTGLMLKTMILRQKAEAARKALPLLDGKVLVDGEKAVTIISQKLMEAFRAGQKVDRFSDQATEYYAPAFELSWAPEIMKALQRREGE